MATMKNASDLVKNNLEVTTSDYYFGTMKPFLGEVLAKCRTDQELDRTVRKVINACDSLCQQEMYAEMAEEFTVLNTAITDHTYFSGIMKNAPEEEKAMVRELADKIQTLYMIIQCEPPVQKKEHKPKDRIDYKEGDTPDKGVNNAYATHNMAALNEPHPKKRIPN